MCVFVGGRCVDGDACPNAEAAPSPGQVESSRISEPAVATEESPQSYEAKRVHMCAFVDGKCVDGELCPNLGKMQRSGASEVAATADPYMSV